MDSTTYRKVYTNPPMFYLVSVAQKKGVSLEYLVEVGVSRGEAVRMVENSCKL